MHSHLAQLFCIMPKHNCHPQLHATFRPVLTLLQTNTTCKYITTFGEQDCSFTNFIVDCVCLLIWTFFQIWFIHICIFIDYAMQQLIFVVATRDVGDIHLYCLHCVFILALVHDNSYCTTPLPIVPGLRKRAVHKHSTERPLLSNNLYLVSQTCFDMVQLTGLSSFYMPSLSFPRGVITSVWLTEYLFC